MNQKEIVKAIAEKTGKTEVETSEYLEAFYTVILENIGDEIKLMGLGVFSSKERSARKVKIPGIEKEVDIPAKWVPIFKANSKLKDAAVKCHA